MKLEVNKSHKGIRFEKLKKPLKRFSVAVAGLAIAISMYSGATKNVIATAAEVERPAITWTIDNHDIEIPESISDEIAFKIGKSSGDVITASDLDSINFITLEIDDNVKSLEFLKYFNNLEIINLFLYTENLEVLNDLSYAKNLTDVSILTRVYDYHTLSNDNLSFIGKSDSIKSLTVDEYVLLSPGCEEELNNLETLVIMSGTNYDIDFSKLKNLKVLDLSYAKPYDVAIYLNSDEYNSLISEGVEIRFSDQDAKNKYLDACKKLDKIVSKLNVDQNSSTSDKINEILIYVLDNLEYDKEISALIKNDSDTDEATKKFYEDGQLYGALYSDSAICGNYTALTEALMDRLDIPQNSFFATSTNHAWNVIRVDEEPYYVDATWLDKMTKNSEQTSESYDENGNKTISITFNTKSAQEVIKEGNGEELNWYKETIDDENISTIDHDHSHNVNYLPDYITKVESKVNDDEKDGSKDITEEEVKLKIGTKEILIGSGALVGVLAALGGGIFVVRKKKKEDERRRRRMMMNNDYFFDSDYDNSYSSPRNRRY